MPDECNSDLFLKLVQDLMDISEWEVLRMKDGHLCSEHNMENQCDAFAKANEKLEKLRKTAAYDANQFYAKCVQPQFEFKRFKLPER